MNFIPASESFTWLPVRARHEISGAVTAHSPVDLVSLFWSLLAIYVTSCYDRNLLDVALKHCHWLLFAGLCAVSHGPAYARSAANSYTSRDIAAVKTTVLPVIDGALTDKCWKSAANAEVFVERQNGSVVADQTTAYLLYDAQYIYIGFRCKDSVPAQITARETVRDSKHTGDFDNTEDNVELTLDPFQSHRVEDLTRFSVNALGTPSARLGGGRGSRAEWKGDWSGAAKRTEDGWTAELRVPWKILNYPNSWQPISIGINFARYQNRTSLASVWSNIGPQNYLKKMGHWSGVQVPAGAFHPALSLLPCLLPGNTGESPTARAGLDARYTVTSELTAVATFSPEFATVEGAVESIQFRRGEQLFPDHQTVLS